MKKSGRIIIGVISTIMAAVAIGLMINPANAAWWWPFSPASGDRISSLSGRVYNGTFYIAAMGGHFAEANITIEPSSPAPLHLRTLDRIIIGDGETHATHDPRIDVENRGVLFWSTYHIDPETGTTHVGKSDLKTGRKIAEINVPVPKKATHTGHMYCASAQTRDYYLPLSMANKAYISVFRKRDLKHIRDVFLEGTDADIHKPYLFYHGVNSPDMKKIFLTINEAETDQGRPVGRCHLFMLDAEALVAGRVKVLAKNVIPGAPGRTMSFRQTFSPDGSMIVNSGGDRMWLIDANTLELLDVEMMDKLEENHDGIFTPDSRYIIATSRTKTLTSGNAPKINRKQAVCRAEITNKTLGPDDYIMDGQLKLYDVKARRFIGHATSVCLSCHNEEGVSEHAVLCGIDANWQ